jgi:hypothetical protein
VYYQNGSRELMRKIDITHTQYNITCTVTVPFHSIHSQNRE